MKEGKSLEKWFFVLMAAGTAIMCVVIVLVSMMLYMRSVRRIYKSDITESANAAINNAGVERIRMLCRTSPDSDKELKQTAGEVQEVFRKICDDGNIKVMTLYAFDSENLYATPVVTAYPEKESPVSSKYFTKSEFNLLLDEKVYLPYVRDRDGSIIGVSFTPITDEDGAVIGLLRIGISVEEIMRARIRFMMFYIPACVLLVIIFAIIASQLLKRRIILPLSKLNTAAAAYGEHRIDDEAEGSDYFAYSDEIMDDEIGRLWKTCASMETSLRASIKNLKAVTAEKEKQAAEVAVAAQIQEGMLPRDDDKFTRTGRFTLKGSMKPAKGVGGDFYDYFMTDDDHLALVIGDVSGKGIPASLFMMMAMTHIRARATGKHSPSDILRDVNNSICASNPEMMFVTIWLGIVDLAGGVMLQCNAGHEYTAVCRSGERFAIDESEHDMPIGIMEDIEFSEKRVELNKGDRIFVYSDGLPEAVNASDEQYGTDRMLEALNLDPGASDEKLLEAVRSSVDDFAAGVPQFDDLTMLSFTYL